MAGFGSIKRAADMQTGPIQHMRINRPFTLHALYFHLA